jgi:hypothetical protein
MKYVGCKVNNDCVVACIAMLSDLTYDEISKFFPKLVENNGVFPHEAMACLDVLKIRYYFRGYLDWEEYLRIPINLKALNDAIFIIKSSVAYDSFKIKYAKNGPVQRHAVIWNSEKKTFWCPAKPPQPFLKSIFKADARTKSYYNALKKASINDIFHIIERK